ncbi:MAG: hypothetical protein KF850_27540 [Labilithrix sp.]|nr:hypothetical protein [Labilithrix sp.]MBX3215823.1 hypothetical protein [Labilithrix sp.]
MTHLGVPPHLDPAARADRVRAAHGERAPARDAVARARLTRGWPNLVEVDPKSTRDPAKVAKKRLLAIDPTHHPVWARDVAVRWLHAFVRGLADHGSAPEATDAALALADAPDASKLRALFERGFASTFGYAFAHADAIFLFEALLGADAVAATFAEAIGSAPPDAWVWPNATRPNPNVRSVAQATAMGWVLLRASEDAKHDALEKLRDARVRALPDGAPPPKGTLARAIDFLLGDALPDLEDEPERHLRVVHLSDDLALARLRHPWRLWIADPQDHWLTGHAMPEHALARLAVEPRWLAAHLSDQWAPLAIPFTEELAAVREELPKRLSKKALDAEVRALFDALVEDVRRARGDRSAEADLFRRAAGTLVILRTRGGDPIPEAHVPHILATDGWDARTAAPMVRLDASPEESERWFAAVDEGSR